MLADKKCVACDAGAKPVAHERIQELLADVPGWQLAAGEKAIKRRFTFPDFASSLRFVNQVADIAEQEQHHPDIFFGWGYAQFELTTHTLGGLHENDFIMAGKINGLHDKA